MRTLHFLTVAVLAIVLQACGGGTEEEHTARIPRAEAPSVRDEAPTNGGSAETFETILPSAPSAPAPTYDSAPYSPPSSSSEEAATPLSLSMTAEKKFLTRLGLVKLSWTATGPIEELYLWSEGFNRFSGDNGSADPCGPIVDASLGVTRHLLVNAMDGANLGADLNEGSPAHTALIPYLDSAQTCDETLCQGFSPSAKTAACRIDLDPSEPMGSFYTRTLTADAEFHICARTAEGTTCKSSQSISVPKASVTQVSAVETGDEKIRFTFAYTYAIRKASAPQGCETITSFYDDHNHGHGTITADCPIIATQTDRFQRPRDLSFGVYGIGDDNSDVHFFKISRHATPEVTLKADGAVTCDDPYKLKDHCEGRIDLTAEAYRAFKLFDSKPNTADELLLEGKVSAGLKLELSSNQGLANYQSRQEIAPGRTSFKGVRRSHAQHQWRATVEADGKTFQGSWLQEPHFPAQFELSVATQTLHPSDWDSCEYEDTDDGESECGVCVETSGFYQASVIWTGRHLKRIIADCTSSRMGVVASGLSINIPDTYEAQGNLLGSPALAIQVPVTGSGWTDQLTCTLTGEAYDGTKVVRVQTWTANCGITHALPGDSHDPDLEGAFIEIGTGWSNGADLYTLVSQQWDGE